jgi:hypothetical protein
VDTHAVLDLLKRPNPMNSGSDSIYALTAWRRIADEAFIVRQPFGSAGKLTKGKPTGPSKDLGDHDDWDRTCWICCRLGIRG